MINIQRLPDDYKIICENKSGKTDAEVTFELKDDRFDVFLTAKESQPEFVMLRWNYKTRENVKVLGDRWERSYADLTWKTLDGERFMPWYFLVSNGTKTVGCGVMVQPASFVSFEYDSSGVSAWFDVRCGSVGVQLNGRKLLIGSVVCRNYSNISSFEATKRFCGVMCPFPILPSEPVYGGNNWYYAYGKSSAEEIYSDTMLQVKLSKGNAVKPFMVIDAGWSPNQPGGPWIPNEKFGDMKAVAEKIKSLGAKPGLWVRFLHNFEMEEKHPECRLNHTNRFLDPSHPLVKELIKSDIERIKGWGFELIKHDFSTVDMFGQYGFELNGTITTQKDWAFYDRTKTSAEIVLDFYRLIRETAGKDVLILGCNTISHLSAGLVEISRTGDDTSGRYWNRTRAIGVNTLAFRLPQNNTFYVVDADCVGIMPNGTIPWKLNLQWATLLSRSGTPLFVSCPNGILNEQQIAELKECYSYAAKQTDVAVPLDWEYNNQPCLWDINGEIFEFDWIMDEYPDILSGPLPPC
ncbi:MAG: alpha-galactosidase [Acutalibacteraceae bacterium]|jgi:alpha-galactosidase